MKHYLKYLLAVLLAAGLAEGAIIAINNIDPGAGTYSNFTTTATDANTFVLTRNFDFDGGGADDTLTFTLIRSTFNGTSTISGSDVTVGTVNSGGNTANWYSNFGNGESLQLRVTDISYISGEADGTIAQFTGFTNASRTNINSSADIDYLIHTGPVGSDVVTVPGGGGIDLTSAGSSNTLFITALPGSDGIRIRDLDLAFETVVVPEPTSTILLGLGGLALMIRRHR